MKKTILTTLFLLITFSIPAHLAAQCTPGDEISCPDPENNGQICPDSLPNAIFEELYSQEFTILAPETIIPDTNIGIAFDLHHIELVDVGNMPPGLTWVSNTADNEFLAGNYYCVLLEGTAEEKGLFPLHIEVSVFLPGIAGSPPIFLATITDSTSLSINVADPSGVEDISSNFTTLEYAPNPFSTKIDFKFLRTNSGEITFEVFNLLGEKVHKQLFLTGIKENKISFDGNQLDPGVYIFKITDKDKTFTGRMIKSE